MHQAGYLGTVDYIPCRGEAGRGLYVEVSRPDGTTIGFRNSRPTKRGAWHVVTYTPFD